MTVEKKATGGGRVWGWVMAVLLLFLGVGWIHGGLTGKGFFSYKYQFQYTAGETLGLGIVSMLGSTFCFWTMIKGLKKKKKVE